MSIDREHADTTTHRRLPMPAPVPRRRTRARLPSPIGRTFGLWVVLADAQDGPSGNRRVRVRCSGCGTEKIVFLQLGRRPIPLLPQVRDGTPARRGVGRGSGRPTDHGGCGKWPTWITLDVQAWRRMPGESARAYHAFAEHFLALLAHERSMNAAYTSHQRLCKHSTNPKPMLSCDPGWYQWRFKFSWVERADSYDAHMAERNRLERLHAITEMNRRHVQFAMDLQSLGIERLKQFLAHTSVATMTPLQLATLLDKSSTVERRAMGEATTITKDLRTQADASAPLNLRALTDEELAIFQQLVAKCAVESPVETL